MESLHAKLNQETARIAWRELARYFAGGKVIRVSTDLDLIEVAAAVAEDDAERVDTWRRADRVAAASDAEALAWHEADTELWAVVVRPFVLVQEPSD